MPAPDPELSLLLRRELDNLSELDRLRPQTPAMRALLFRLTSRHRYRVSQLEALLTGQSPADVTTRAESLPSASVPSLERSAAAMPPPSEAPPLAKDEARLETARLLTPTVRELTFQAGRPFSWRPGQYVQLSVPTDSGISVRDYSIAIGDPQAGRFTLWIKRVVDGPSSARLHTLPAGTVLHFSGPTGGFVLEPPGPELERVVFIGTGTGLAPLYAQLTALVRMPGYQGPIDLLWGVRKEEDVFYELELGELERIRPGLSISIFLSEPADGSRRRIGRVTDQLEAESETWLEGAEFYLAGNGQMIRDATALLRRRGIDARRIHTEAFFKS